MAAVVRLVRLAWNVSTISKGPSVLQTKVLPRSPAFHNALRLDVMPVRNSSFFVKLTAGELWKGVVSVSSAGRRRGRGKRRSRSVAKNLNKGQVIGVGKVNMVWPGLNAPILRGKEMVEQRQLPPDLERDERLIRLREEGTVFRAIKLSPLERGFSGTQWPGRSIGPPDTVGDETFEGFDTKVLELKGVFSMTATFGRKRRVSVFVVTGNKNGSAGFALSKSVDMLPAMRKAKNRAAQRLVYIERYDNHTVYHDFHTRFGQTEIFVHKKPKGYGLVCHRVLRCICEMIGITDIHAKVEGAMNVQNMTKAFVLGLINQKTHQMMADEKSLYLIERSSEYDYFPRIVAAPTRVRTEQEIPKDEVLDYDDYIYEGKREYVKPKREPFYRKLPGWQRHLKKTHPYRNLEECKVKILAEHDKLDSFIFKDAVKDVIQTDYTKTD